MRIRTIIICLVLGIVLGGCSKETESGQQPTITKTGAATPTLTPTEAIEPVTPTMQPEELAAEEITDGADITPDEDKETVVEEINLFAKIYPDRDDGSILSGKEFGEIAPKLTDGMRCRLTEITYTYKSGKISMETLAGNEDVFVTNIPSEESPLQLVYDESEWYNYVLYLPENYDADDTETKWPVIYFFHGIGEKGSDLNKLLDYGVLDYIGKGASVPAIVIAPQCPGDSHWADTDVEEPRLAAFIEENNEKYNIDTNRIYATGLSMGGRCTWKQVLAMPDTFAAAVVVCGRTNTYDFSEILDMPIWMFHGAMDDTVAFQNVNRIVTELFSQEHEYFKLTVYPYLSHDVWTTTYSKAQVYEWMLAQNLQNRESINK